MERENFAGDAKGKGTSGDHREAESTDASVRGGLPRSSAEGSVMELERRGQVIGHCHVNTTTTQQYTTSPCIKPQQS